MTGFDARTEIAGVAQRRDAPVQTFYKRFPGEFLMIEKRKFLRLPIMYQIGEPIDMVVDGKISQGVIIDLSAGGMLVLGYANIMVNSEVIITIDIPSLKTNTILGKAIWTKAEINMYKSGITFNEIDPVDFININRMAVDFNECNAKIKSGINDPCFPKCHYYGLCYKPQKENGRVT